MHFQSQLGIYLHLLDFCFRSVTLYVFLCVSRADYRAATASGGASQLESNNVDTVSGSVIYRGSAFDTRRLPVLQHGRSVFSGQHPGDILDVDSHSIGEPLRYCDTFGKYH